jgi:hypothetical protein
VLKKDPMSRDVGDDDKFFFNETFASKFLRVKVGVVASGNRVETERERMKTERKNEEDRNYICEAAIVRVMKYVSRLLSWEGCPVNQPLLDNAKFYLTLNLSGRLYKSSRNSSPRLP